MFLSHLSVDDLAAFNLGLIGARDRQRGEKQNRRELPS
jgi:hypothetical protein